MKNTNLELLKKYDEFVWNYLNNTRIKNFSFVMILLTLLLFVFDYLNNSNGLWKLNHTYVLLFYSHIILFLGLSIFIGIFFINKNSSNYLFTNYTIIFSIFFIDCTAYISGYVDQMIHGQITVYFIGSFVIAMLFYFKTKYIIMIYLQSYLLFIIFLHKSQSNSEFFQGNSINSVIIIILSCFICISISKLKINDCLHKYKLEELVKTRSDALIIQQQAINHLQQFNLIGELSAGIAHEIRNPMTTIKDFFNLMIDELDRANLIITEFLSLTKDRKNNFEKKNLNDIIMKLIPLIDTSSSYDIITNLKEIPELFLDDKEICQVILNLANNGRESMPDGGCLTISTHRIDNKVILEIQDQGKGIDPEILDKIGTPFFTTKSKGTGLGLSVSSSIINRHNAKLEIKSDSNGSNFSVIFNIA